ncbi:MAG: four helix bundle protein [Gemmataceae bacterium]
MSLQNYKELEVWQVAMDLVEQCYQTTRAFPKDELFGLTSQIRRAAVSVPANIAEGQGRSHTREFLHFLSVARGSLMELETHVLIGQRIGLLTQVQAEPLCGLIARIGQMLTRLRQSLERRAT